MDLLMEVQKVVDMALMKMSYYYFTWYKKNKECLEDPSSEPTFHRSMHAKHPFMG